MEFCGICPVRIPIFVPLKLKTAFECKDIALKAEFVGMLLSYKYLIVYVVNKCK